MDKKPSILTFMAQACCFAQVHIDNPDDTNRRRYLLQCTSYQIAAFLSIHTVGSGGSGQEIPSDIILNELSELPMKSFSEWKTILNHKAALYGGWK
jgi:hypothetical protein